MRMGENVSSGRGGYNRSETGIHDRPLRPKPEQGNAVKMVRNNMKYRNSWHRKEVDESTQKTFPTPLKKDPVVAIIGGGLSGLCCARRLAQLGIKSVIFDTGEHGVGGRMATRRSDDESIRDSWMTRELAGAGLFFDHAAQCFTVTDPRFKELVDEWVQEGLTQRWQGVVGTLSKGRFIPLPESSPPLFVGSQGMRELARNMLSNLVSKYSNRELVKVVRPMWVSQAKADLTKEGGWKLTGNRRPQGTYDALVIAHNGKCANRLVGDIGAPFVARQLMSLRLSAVWVMMVAFPQPLPTSIEGAFVEGDPVLSWVANNTAKLGLSHPGWPHLQCWTLVSTNTYGQRNKVPQEAIPPEVHDKVSREMLQALARLLSPAPGTAATLPQPVFVKSQLWGAALPINSPKVDCIWDAASRVGVCGDWLQGASLQAAAVSGCALAERIAMTRGQDTEALGSCSLGLKEPCQDIKNPDLGEFPGVTPSVGLQRVAVRAR